MISNETMILLTLLQLTGLGRKTIGSLLPLSKQFSYDANGIKELLTIAREQNHRIREYSESDIHSAIDSQQKIVKTCDRLNISIVSINDPAYPRKINKNENPPIILYYLGSIEQIDTSPSMAIIGTREPSEYGYRIAIRVGESAAKNSILTVSGLATGCDTGGHIGTIQSSGKTIAILANGLDTVYPATNKDLAKRIIDSGGAIISEYPPYSKIQKGYFVDRDRLQAAFSDAVFVVETGIQGGTMHTVDFAIQYNKKVFCFNHPERMREQEKAKGNQLLINSKKARGISNKEDIERMFTIVKAEHDSMQNNSESSNNDEDGKAILEQITLWD